MTWILISDLPGEEPGTRWKAYREATDALYQRCPSDKAYEDVMNGYAYLNENDELVYYPCVFQQLCGQRIKRRSTPMPDPEPVPGSQAPLWEAV